MKRLLPILFVFIIGCYDIQFKNEFFVEEKYEHEIQTTLDVWSTQRSLSLCDISLLKGVVLNDVETHFFCNAPRIEGRGIFGCYWSDHDIIINKNHYYIILNGDFDFEKRGTVVHETLHFLLHCSSDFNSSGTNHDNLTIWDRGGILDQIYQKLGYETECKGDHICNPVE